MKKLILKKGWLKANIKDATWRYKLLLKALSPAA